MLTAGRANYLEKHGWIVHILFNWESTGESEIPSLTKYIFGCGLQEIGTRPYKMSAQVRNRTLDRMIDILRIDNTIDNEIIIESHYDVAAYWAELLAERIHARHFFVACNETYRDSGRFYSENLDFFYFKYQRGELFSTNLSLQKLFEGYRGLENFKVDIPSNVKITREQDAVQDIENQDIELKTRGGGADFSIAYMGRTLKQYVPAIFNGVVEFAKKYSDKKIRLMIVGKIWNQNQIAMFNGVKNIEVIQLGNLIPIPRKLFQNLDVICAGSQTAIFCSYENVPVIIANAHGDTTPGLLYYDTDESVHNEHLPQMSYAEMFDKVLIHREYENRKPNFPEYHPADWHYGQLLKIQRKNSTPLEYFTDKFKRDFRRNWIAQFPFHKVQFGDRIVIYGYGDIGRDYQKQIADGKFCKLVAIVADNHDKYDRTILSPEKLRDLDYDSIIIAESSNPDRINRIMAKISQIVTNTTICIHDFNKLVVD